MAARSRRAQMPLGAIIGAIILLIILFIVLAIFFDFGPSNILGPVEEAFKKFLP